MARIGAISCPLCHTADIAVTETGAGTVNLKCHRCELSSYAKPGSRAARLIRQDMTPDDDAPPAPAAAPAAPPPAAKQVTKATAPATPKNAATPPPAAAPVKKIPNSVFSLSDL